jgi:hypothetical protein
MRTTHDYDYEHEREFKGWVTEWLIVHAWKACVPKGTGGSNPPPSAFDSLTFFQHLQLLSQFDHAAVRQDAAEVHGRINHAVASDHRTWIDHSIATDLRPIANDRAEFS